MRRAGRVFVLVHADSGLLERDPPVAVAVTTPLHAADSRKRYVVERHETPAHDRRFERLASPGNGRVLLDIQDHRRFRVGKLEVADVDRVAEHVEALAAALDAEVAMPGRVPRRGVARDAGRDLLVSFEGPDPALRHVRFRAAEPAAAAARLEVDVGGSLVVDDATLARAAAAQGAGTAFLADSFVKAALGRGELMMLLEAFAPVRSGFFLFAPPGVKASAAVRAVAAVLEAPLRST